MSRWFRFYEKKRGDRRTGSKGFGSFGEALFFAVFLLVGCIALGALLFTLVIPEWRANRHFVPATCEVLGKRLGQRVDREGTSYRPEIHIAYAADGRRKETWTYDVTGMYLGGEEKAREVLRQFRIGEQYPCWYDPIDPSRAVVVRGYSGWLYIFLTIPISFITIGLGGLIYTLFHWGNSAERRAAIAQHRSRTSLFNNAGEGHEFPHVPGDANLTNSPGTMLAYRLPVGSAPGWTLFAALVACLVWNSIVAIFVVMEVRSYLEGEPDWLTTMALAPFVFIGGGLVYYLVRQLLKTTGVGPTRVEISHHPLYPGQQYEIFLSQAGRLSLRSLEVILACDEQATYRQGTDTRTETQRVYEEHIFHRADFEISQSAPFEDRCRLHVPEDAMHSFKAGHNEINWKIVVRGNVERWPDYERVFPIVVCPGTLGL